jgi:NAD(P)-dependent dehydrogenase (short-subunit alcohol dehydrogenase family)
MMDLRLAGKSALITGASKGIGLACAKALAQEGCHTVIAARNADTLAAARTAVEAVAKGAAVTAVTADLSKQDDRAMLIERFGACEILINNAGANPPGEIDTVSEETWRKAWELKLFGYIAMTRGFYTEMKKRRHGVIVNIIGVGGERMDAGYILGATGNIALMGMSRALGGRSPDHGVRVVAVNPGYTETDRGIMMLRAMAERDFGTPDRWEDSYKNMNFPFGRMGTADEVGDLVAFLASPRAAYISGTVVTIDGGYANRS